MLLSDNNIDGILALNLFTDVIGPDALHVM
jgi:hypothetical protein